MNIIVTDRQSMEEGIVVRSSYAVISICDPGRTKAKIKKASGLVDVLYLSFHDAEPTDSLRLPPDIKPMTREQAEAIWRFVDTHKDSVGAFVIHCHQGMSRSPAIAAALARFLYLDDREFGLRYQPNPFIYHLMLRTMPKSPERHEQPPEWTEEDERLADQVLQQLRTGRKRDVDPPKWP